MTSESVRAGLSALAAAAMLSACASSPKKIEAAHVSPVKFQNYTCDQMSLERSAVEYRANVLYHSLKRRADGDKVKMGVGAVLFLPALFFLKGNGTKASEFAQMKGDYTALRLASEDRGCGLYFGDLEELAAERIESAELVIDDS